MEAASTVAFAMPQGGDEILDLARLCDPVSGERPTGIDLREHVTSSSLYYRLRESRTTARNSERAALANGETLFISAADWADILELAPQILADQSKDLEVVAWLIEALTRTHGFRGVAAGFELARRLINDFGDQLHPLPDEDGVSTQLAALTGLNGFGSEGALIAPLKSIPLTEGSPPAPFSAWQCEQAFETERIGDQAKRAARGKRGFVLRGDIDKAVAESEPRFFAKRHAEIAAALSAFFAYRQSIDRYSGSTPQPTARIEETIASIQQILRHIAGDKLATTPPAVEADDAAGNDPDRPEPNSAPAAPAATDRDAALRQLREVAVFFRRTEPHSPISYAVEQAVRWSELSLPELIGELIPDEPARDRFKTLTGIRITEK